MWVPLPKNAEVMITLRLQVRVRVLDKNDVAPSWGAGPWRFEVSEEAPPNTLVSVLRAHDPDTIGSLKYSLVVEKPPSDEENLVEDAK